MKKISAISLIICSVIASVNIFAKSPEQPLDKTVAIINDDVITRSELNQAIETSQMQLAQEHVTPPALSVLQKQVLDRLINKKIQLQLAKQAGVEVTDADLAQAIGHIAEQNHMTVAELYERLEQEGMAKETYRREMREQMTVHKLQQQEIASKITITPQEVSNFVHSHAWQSSSTKEYHLKDILIPLSDTPSTSEIAAAKKRAETVVARLRAGKNFDEVAQAESGGNQALQGGDLGSRKLPEIPSAFADYVVRMKDAEIAGPIQTSNGFHIIHLVEARSLGGKELAISNKMIESQLLQQKFEEAAQNWVSKMRGQAFVVINL